MHLESHWNRQVDLRARHRGGGGESGWALDVGEPFCVPGFLQSIKRTTRPEKPRFITLSKHTELLYLAWVDVPAAFIFVAGQKATRMAGGPRLEGTQTR